MAEYIFLKIDRNEKRLRENDFGHMNMIKQNDQQLVWFVYIFFFFPFVCATIQS